MQKLRDYQERGLAQIVEAYREGARSVLAVLPTGGGKTTIFTHLTAQVQSVVILVHRRELATQASNRLREFGVPFGFIMAGERPNPVAKTQIASVQTLVRRKVPPASLVICDEAHLSTAKTWQTILDAYPRARILGVTATPWRLGGKPLAGAYDRCVVMASPRELREQGHLSPYVGFSYKTPDLTGIKTTGGDYNEQQSAEAMSNSLIVDNIVEEYAKHARELSTVVFAVTVDHSMQLTAKFKAAGISAEHLDGSTPLEQRKAILKRVESGKTMVLCNVGVAVEGLDIPRLKCCVLARPTKSLARAIQMMGRVRRPWNGVTARIHDHAFNIKLHGLPDADRDYALTAKPEKPPSLTQCEECMALYSGPSCPACGKENEVQPQGDRELNTVSEAEKIEFASGDEAAHEVTRPPVEVRWDNIGRAVEGVFERAWDETTQYGKLKTYLVKGAKRHYRFHGTTRLNQLMSKVKPDQKIRVTFTGETDVGAGRARKEFRVEVDDDSESHFYSEATKAEAIRLYVQDKLSSTEISKRLNASAPSVSNWIRAAGVTREASERIRLAKTPDEALIHEVAQRYQAGQNTPQIARELGVGESTARAYLKLSGITLRSSGESLKVNSDLPEIWRSEYVAGKSASQIAQAYDVGTGTVTRYLKRIGVQMRTQSEAEALKYRD